MKYAGPLDFMLVYLSSNLGVGQAMRPERIRQRLAALPRDRVLVVLAQLSCVADTTKYDARYEQITRQILPEPHATKAINMMRAEPGPHEPRYRLLSSQMLVALAVEAVLHCSDSDGAVSNADLMHEVGMLLLALAGNEGRVQLEDMPVEVLRMDLWARVHDFDRWAEVLHRIVSEALPALKSEPYWIDYERIIEAAVGIPPENFRALTAAFSTVAMADSQGHLYPKKTDSKLIPAVEVEKWTRFYMMPVDAARRAAAEDIRDARHWSFTTFYDRPLLPLGSGSLVLVRPWFLMIKATPLGFFTDVERMIRAAGGDVTEWSNLFGKAVEWVGRRVIEENVDGGARKLLDEVAIVAAWGAGATGQRRTCDAVLIDGDWLALDFVFHRVKKETATTGDLSDLVSDVQKSVVGKLAQIDQTLQRGLAAEKLSGSIFPIVVIGAPFSANAAMLNLVDDMADKAGFKVIGANSRCEQPMVMDMEEFWMLLELGKHESVFPTKLLKEWMDSPKRVSGFRSWAITEGHKLRNPRRRGYAAHAMMQLFGRVK